MFLLEPSVDHLVCLGFGSDDTLLGPVFLPLSSQLTNPKVISNESLDTSAIPVYPFDSHDISPTSSVKDPISVIVFPDAGGLITYVKADRNVHTLNTPSGLKRKLDAIGLNADKIISAGLEVYKTP